MLDLERELTRLKRAGLLRHTREITSSQGPSVGLDGQRVVLLCSNNYLGFADHPRVREAAAAAVGRWGVGAGASRLISGTMEPHRELEAALAEFMGTDSALLFGSGYLANTGVVAALGSDPAGTVLSDARNHASIVDACRQAKARTRVYRHRDLDHLEWLLRDSPAGPRLIVSDTIFSMDGDVAPLPGLVELARRHGARLVVDEAHAVGAYGPAGRGVAAAAGLEGEIDAIVGTLGKALGSYGAYVACSRRMSQYLVNCARTFIFSTAPPPALAVAAREALALLRERPQLPRLLQSNSDVLRRSLREHGFDTGESETHIIPLLFGEPGTATAVSEGALANGVLVSAIRPPTVPSGTSRLRLVPMSAHSPRQLTKAAAKLARATAEAGLEIGTSPFPPSLERPERADSVA